MSAQPVTAEGLQVLSDEAAKEKRAATGRYIQVGVCAILALLLFGNGAGLGMLFVILAVVFGINGGTHSRRARDLQLQLKLAMAQAEAQR